MLVTNSDMGVSENAVKTAKSPVYAFKWEHDDQPLIFQTSHPHFAENYPLFRKTWQWEMTDL